MIFTARRKSLSLNVTFSFNYLYNYWHVSKLCHFSLFVKGRYGNTCFAWALLRIKVGKKHLILNLFLLYGGEELWDTLEPTATM